jgi:hypothetical protein
MASGELAIGSRQPTRYPVWVTFEVTTGGFATGTALVGETPEQPWYGASR